MDPETCKRILDGVKDLQKETDWFVINKEVVNSQASADVSKALNTILMEYDVFVKARVDSLIQKNESEQASQKAVFNKDPPLGANQFSKEYHETLASQYLKL